MQRVRPRLGDGMTAIARPSGGRLSTRLLSLAEYYGGSRRKLTARFAAFLYGLGGRPGSGARDGTLTAGGGSGRFGGILL